MTQEHNDLVLVGLIAAGIPTVTVSLISYFAKRTLEGIESSIKELSTKVEGLGHQVTALDKGGALLELRVVALERDVMELRRMLSEGK